jgi:hypothetical protein
MIYFQEVYAEISWDEVCQAVVLVWKGFAPLQKTQLVLNKVLEVLEQKKGYKFLADSRNMLAFNKEAEEWMLHDWVPRSKAANLKIMAYIVPKSAMTRTSLSSMRGRTGLETVAYFDSVEEAKTWLASQ